ncbi:MAG: MBL fold metallo-hydrolase [Syntrophales bacterium]
MEITFLGTNGWYDSPTGNTICTLIATADCNIFLDAGSGLPKADKILDQSKQTFIFLSHFHLDHIIGLHALAKFRFQRPLVFLIREGSTGTLRSFVASPFTVPLDILSFTASIMELPKEQERLPFHAEVFEMVHPDPTIGIRLNLEGKTIAYCPDTGYCPNCVTLAEKADLLIAECAYRPGEDSEMWPHLNPQKAATIAQEAKVKRLVLTHFDAERYQSLTDREEALAAARPIFPPTEIGKDGYRIDL